MSRSRPSAQDWSLNEEEVAYYMDAKPAVTKGTTAYKCYVPKLMPAVDKGVAMQIPTTVRRGMFCNSAACRPKTSLAIKTANYITIKTADNQKFERDALLPTSKVKIRCVGESVDQLSMTNHVDNSIQVKYSANSLVQGALK